MRNKTVLLVDDEQPVLESLGNYLERNSFNVTSVLNGKDALAAFRSTYFDLVITDLVMPGMSGLELVKEIKNINFETGAFIFTGHGDMVLAIDALRSGADDFFLKPCDADELVRTMERFFEKQEAFKKIKIYEKILPICMYCKKIRDTSSTESGTERWMEIDEYLYNTCGVEVSHGCCPDCFVAQTTDVLKS
jgi:YesN/AraC family two-component response regulator